MRGQSVVRIILFILVQIFSSNGKELFVNVASSTCDTLTFPDCRKFYFVICQPPPSPCRMLSFVDMNGCLQESDSDGFNVKMQYDVGNNHTFKYSEVSERLFVAVFKTSDVYSESPVAILCQTNSIGTNSNIKVEDSTGQFTMTFRISAIQSLSGTSVIPRVTDITTTHIANETVTSVPITTNNVKTTTTFSSSHRTTEYQHKSSLILSNLVTTLKQRTQAVNIGQTYRPSSDNRQKDGRSTPINKATLGITIVTLVAVLFLIIPFIFRKCKIWGSVTCRGSEKQPPNDEAKPTTKTSNGNTLVDADKTIPEEVETPEIQGITNESIFTNPQSNENTKRTEESICESETTIKSDNQSSNNDEDPVDRNGKKKSNETDSTTTGEDATTKKEGSKTNSILSPSKIDQKNQSDVTKKRNVTNNLNDTIIEDRKNDKSSENDKKENDQPSTSTNGTDQECNNHEENDAGTSSKKGKDQECDKRVENKTGTSSKNGTDKHKKNVAGTSSTNGTDQECDNHEDIEAATSSKKEKDQECDKRVENKAGTSSKNETDKHKKNVSGTSSTNGTDQECDNHEDIEAATSSKKGKDRECDKRVENKAGTSSKNGTDKHKKNEAGTSSKNETDPESDKRVENKAGTSSKNGTDKHIKNVAGTLSTNGTDQECDKRTENDNGTSSSTNGTVPESDKNKENTTKNGKKDNDEGATNNPSQNDTDGENIAEKEKEKALNNTSAATNDDNENNETAISSQDFQQTMIKEMRSMNQSLSRLESKMTDAKKRKDKKISKVKGKRSKNMKPKTKSVSKVRKMTKATSKFKYEQMKKLIKNMASII